MDFADFLVLADHFAQAGGWSDGDFDANGDIQFSDFLAQSWFCRAIRLAVAQGRLAEDAFLAGVDTLTSLKQVTYLRLTEAVSRYGT